MNFPRPIFPLAHGHLTLGRRVMMTLPAPLDKSGWHAAPPSRGSAPVRSPAGKYLAAAWLPDGASDSRLRPAPPPRSAHYAGGSTPPGSGWLPLACPSLAAASFSPADPGASHDCAPPAPSLAGNDPR